MSDGEAFDDAAISSTISCLYADVDAKALARLSAR